MSADRTALAAEQARLVAALTGGAAAPAGFDSRRARLAAESLAAKRRRSVARAWPALAAALGESFAARFDVYASETPLAADSPAADGRAFARWLDRAGNLPEVGRVMLFASDLTSARPFAIRMRWLPQSRRLFVGIRVPWRGARLFAVPLGMRAGRTASTAHFSPNFVR